MRETRTSGSEGGAGQTNAPFLPLSSRTDNGTRTEAEGPASLPRGPTTERGRRRRGLPPYLTDRQRNAAEAEGPASLVRLHIHENNQ